MNIHVYWIVMLSWWTNSSTHFKG